eukprot:SAG11_NODE_36564_length_261_cov_0.561728_1_plen_54_part_01
MSRSITHEQNVYMYVRCLGMPFVPTRWLYYMKFHSKPQVAWSGSRNLGRNCTML